VNPLATAQETQPRNLSSSFLAVRTSKSVEDQPLSAWAVAASVIGSVLAVAAIIAIVLCRCRAAKQEKDVEEMEIADFHSSLSQGIVRIGAGIFSLGYSEALARKLSSGMSKAIVSLSRKDAAELAHDVQHGLIMAAACAKDYEAAGEAYKLVCSAPPEQLGATVVRLYSRETFVYRRLNGDLRELLEPPGLTEEQANNLGDLTGTEATLKKQLGNLAAFCLILWSHLLQEREKASRSRVRGMRGSAMAEQDFHALERAVGSFVAFSPFLSCSQDPNVALAFANRARAAGKHAVLFEIVTPGCGISAPNAGRPSCAGAERRCLQISGPIPIR
jgi:hypothetical protein